MVLIMANRWRVGSMYFAQNSRVLRPPIKNCRMAGGDAAPRPWQHARRIIEGLRKMGRRQGGPSRSSPRPRRAVTRVSQSASRVSPASQGGGDVPPGAAATISRLISASHVALFIETDGPAEHGHLRRALADATQAVAGETDGLATSRTMHVNSAGARWARCRLTLARKAAVRDRVERVRDVVGLAPPLATSASHPAPPE